MSNLHFFLLLLLFFFLFALITNASLSSTPPPKFTWGTFGTLSAEYGATYRPLPISKPPFQLCFYNTTPNSYTLAVGLFTPRSHPATSVRWVWEANRGNPVGNDAELVLRRDGNLILVDSDAHHRVAWQTNTSASTHKNYVTKIKLSRKGNLILYAKEGDGRTIILWQSFDHPTDTLLMDQSLIQDQAPTTVLVSRASNRANIDGRYSLVLEPERVAFHYQGTNSPKLIYDVLFEPDFSDVGFMRLETVKSKKGYDIILRFGAYVVEDERDYYTFASHVTYNTGLSFLRLGMDGNLRVFTYNNGTGFWNQTFALFSKNQDWESECRLPEKCGSFGLCDQSQCVACPSPSGSSNWTKDCKPSKLTTCKVEDIGYYKLVGVTQYMAGDWNEFLEFIEEPDCRRNCTTNCKCLGYFYNEYRRQCWPAYDLNTLMNVSDAPGRVTYIKYQLK